MQVAKRVEGRLFKEAKELAKKQAQQLEPGQQPPPAPRPRTVSTTQVALNYVRYPRVKSAEIEQRRDGDAVSPASGRSGDRGVE